MSGLLYNISIHLLNLLIRIAALFNPKARLWVKGRKGLLGEIKKKISSDANIAWFHCASLGEFEQGRPLIEKFKEMYPDYSILLTFFSPSGFEIRKNYDKADFVFYLPVDTHRNALQFIKYIQPRVAFFVKYEYWYNYISIMHRYNIPIFIVSAIFRTGQPFFRWYGTWFRKQLGKITFFFTQNEISQKLLHSISITKCLISGDTRFDRVAQIAVQKRSFPIIEKFVDKKSTLVAGSTWPTDDEVLSTVIGHSDYNLKYIIAPHEINHDKIDLLIKKNKLKGIKYSDADEDTIHKYDILFIDSIGMLAFLYRYADIAYIGGGFGKGIHNILEAVTFGKPVLFGPNYTKFQEAKDLISEQGAFSIKNEVELRNIIEKLFNDELFYQKCVDACNDYILRNLGATAKILKQVSELIIN